MAVRPPKQWRLTEDESFSSFTNWKGNMIYTLNQDDSFKPFLVLDATWQKSNRAVRGMVTDPPGTNNHLTAAQKCTNLTQMLGLIAQWVPHYLSTDIIKNSTSMGSIWDVIRKYYGFQQSETQFMKYSSISWEEGERPERLYQRILAHLQDNLLQNGSKLKHDGNIPTTDEELSPTVERLAVLRWMELIHPSLPALVQRTFAYDLQRMTLKDMQPQIVDALDGFVEELRHDEVKAYRVFTSQPRRGRLPNRQSHRSYQTPKANTTYTKNPKGKECRVCKSEGRLYYGHSMADCDYISKADKRAMSTAFRVDFDEDHVEVIDELSDQLDTVQVDDSA